MKAKRKVAVTGASGFVGRHVLSRLLNYDVDVVGITRNKKNLIEYADRIEIIEYDLESDNDNVFEYFGSPDILMHLAWDGLPHYKSNRHFEKELPQQFRFLRRMIAGGLKSLLVTGTCFEYGMQAGSLVEDTDCHPINPYGFAKNVLRKQLEFLQTEYNFEMAWVRLFYMYGEGQNSSSLFQQLKNAVFKKEDVFNMSMGEQLRDFLPISDVVSALVHIALYGSNVGVVNVCSGQPRSIRGIVEKWIQENSWDIRLNLGYYPYPDYEPMAFWGNRDKLDIIYEITKHGLLREII